MMKKKEEGITLIAVVITIIILLILAGVSIAMLSNDNGILGKADMAAKETTISGIEEEANVIYLDIMSQEFGKEEEKNKVDISDIIKELNKRGYQTEQVVKIEDQITGISLDKNTTLIIANKTEKVKVIYEGSPEAIDSYVVIKDEYYKMQLNNNGVEIDKTASVIENDGEKLQAVVTSGTNVTIGEIYRSIVTLQAGSIGGNSAVSISCGEHSEDCMVTVIVPPSEQEGADFGVEINTDYGLVDVIWLSGDTNKYSSIPNEPDLYTNLEENKRLKPVTWTYNNKKGNWKEDTVAKTTWYSYTTEKGNDGKEDNTTSMWANAKNSDGSYFVWIPRYAYRITYYSDASYTNVTGYYDGYGMWEIENGKKKCNLDEGIETIEHDGKKYIVHPAFMKDIEKEDAGGNKIEDYARGGWDKNLTGIWVAKYEMSREGATEKTSGSGYNTVFYSVPDVQGAKSITIGNMFSVSLKYDKEKESHMIKNSEWGAVAFLTHSKYGRNGHEIDENSGSITGSGDINKLTNPDETCNYNTTLGAKASTTGNIYGIYDLSGGSWEHVAGFNKAGVSSRMGNGANMINTAKDAEGNYISTKYVTAYINEAEDKSGSAQLFLTGKIGDATKEVRKTTEETNWFSDNSVFIIPRAPYFGRGGAAEGIYAGVFYSDSTYGQSLGGVSFRLVLGK